MEKSDNAAVSVAEENNLLLRLTVAQLVSINSRLDTLETRINCLLERLPPTSTTPFAPTTRTGDNRRSSLPTTTTTENDSNTSSTPTTTTGDSNTSSTPTTTTGDNSNTATTISQTSGEDNSRQGEVIWFPDVDFPNVSSDVECVIEARISSMRAGILEDVGQTMYDSMMRTKTVIETSMTKMSEDLRQALESTITTMATEIQDLKRAVGEISTKTRSLNPPAKEADIRNTMEKFQQTLTALKNKYEKEMDLVQKAQTETSEEIRKLNLEITQLKQQRNSTTRNEAANNMNETVG